MCHEPGPLIPDDSHCEVFHTCNTTWTSGSCEYPDLFSTVTKRCEPFENVDCNNKTVPLSPCKSHSVPSIFKTLFV